jgi:hypothetical protein
VQFPPKKENRRATGCNRPAADEFVHFGCHESSE